MRSTVVSSALLAAVLAAPLSAQCRYGPAPEARGELAATGVGGLALFAGGLRTDGEITDRVDVLDTATGTWTQASLSAARSRAAAVTVGDRALFAGGLLQLGLQLWMPFDTVDLYDAASDTWSTATLSQARFGIAAAVSGGRAYFGGGFEGGLSPGDPVATLDVYDSATGQWSTSALPNARGDAAAVAVGGKVLFAGGYGAERLLDSVDVLDVATGLWSTTTLSEPRAGLVGVAVGDWALFAGGHGAWNDTIEVYDATTGQWSQAFLSEARFDLQAVTVGSLAIFAGGVAQESLAPTATADVFDASSVTFFTAELPAPRAAGSWAAVGDEAFLMGGFATFPGAWIDGVERWTAGAPVPYGSGLQTTCPCANHGAFLAGCGNSTGSGAQLRGSGCPSASSGGLALEATRLPAGSSALLFRGTPAAPSFLGDGQLLLAAPFARLSVQAADASGAVAWSSGLAGLGAPGSTVGLQVRYRDAAGPCGSGANLTNGVRVVLGP